MVYKINRIVNIMEKLAPPSLAEEWDNSGLQIGDATRRVTNILLSLDVNPGVVDEAIALGAELIITHHPLIFPNTQSIDLNKPLGKVIDAAIKGDISIYSAHTNLDKAKGGVNDQLARVLGLKDVKTLLPEQHNLYKLVVFVPKTAEIMVKQALGDIGSGVVGNYSHCSFAAPGEGNFKPLHGATPAIGEIDSLTSVEEVRLEVLVRANVLAGAVSAMLKAHPYEEVAYDVYPLKNSDDSFGLGRIGTLKAPVKLSKFIDICRKNLRVQPRVAGNVDSVQKVAVCGGSGAGLISTAKKADADLLVTGDIKYHDAWLTKDLNFCVIDCGHDATEKIVLKFIKKYLRAATADELNISISKLPTSPWRPDE